MYRTGDRASIASDGAVRFLGRIDDGQIQIRGHRIELDEVAVALTGHPDVSQSAVVVRDDGGERRLVAYVVPRSTMPGRSALRQYLAERLPGPMVPVTYAEIDALPLTTNGKLDRNALPAPPRDVVVGSVPPEGPTETAIADILEELIELDGIGRDDNFFELGGHSLMGAQLVARLQERFGIELPLLAVFENPTVAEMASRRHRDLDRTRRDDVRRGGGAAPRLAPWANDRHPPEPRRLAEAARVPRVSTSSSTRKSSPTPTRSTSGCAKRRRSSGTRSSTPGSSPATTTSSTVLHTFSANRTPTPEQLAALGMEKIAPIAALMVRQMLFLDPPEHTRVRMLAAKAFTPASGRGAARPHRRDHRTARRRHPAAGQHHRGHRRSRPTPARHRHRRDARRCRPRTGRS